VTAACLASRGHSVIGLDDNEDTISTLAQGTPPLFEPGLAELTNAGLKSATLTFTTSHAEALKGADVVWITYDTPVDENDNADVAFVANKIRRLFPLLPQGCVVLISSQVPVETTQLLAAEFKSQRPDANVGFAYSPENLRLGSAIKVFTEPDRIVVGCASPETKATITALLTPITDRIEWMGVASAEMVKHATNAFLATSVTFINEIATICERTGASAKEVERGLKSESRIGPRAYLSPGAAFAGGTLARDIAFLGEIATHNGLQTPLLSSVPQSNLFHKEWPYRRLAETLGTLRNKTIAVWGLTYKPGTDTLRRSSAIELCTKLSAAGATVQAFDPAVRALPTELQSRITLCTSPLDAVTSADALVVATAWPEFREVSMSHVATLMSQPIVIDANSSLAQQCASATNIRYFSVGITA
jgi:UDPglucose 6-dehydrogenase